MEKEQQTELDTGTVMDRVAKPILAAPLALVGVCKRSKLRGSYNSVSRSLPTPLRFLRSKASALSGVTHTITYLSNFLQY